MLHLTSVSLLEYTVPVSLVCTCRFPQLCTPPCWTPWWVGSGVGEHSPLNMTSQNQKPKTPKKRHIVDSDSELSLENEPLTTPTDDWPRFIILTSANSERPIGKLSPFAIHKGILGIAGVVKDVKKLRSGDILVECAKKAHAENLLRATALVGVGMKASPHRSLNSSKGVIRTRDLGDMDEEEIASELRDQGVLSVRRITIKKDGNIINTNTYILTFSKPSPPERLRIGYLSVHVDLFIPNPLRCFSCQKYGHGRDSCKNLPACFRCGQQGHDSTDCQKAAKCANCQGDHVAASKDCPVWKKEKQIQKVKTENHLGYPEARRLVEGATPSPGAKTYAAVSRVSTRTVDCQTDITWLSRERPLAMNSGKSQTPVSTKAQIHQSTNTHPVPQTSAPTSTPPQTARSPSRNAQHGRPQPGAGAVGSQSHSVTHSQSKAKKKPLTDRQPKGSDDPIAQANRFLLLPDNPGEVEMAEAAPRGGRSRSPKNKPRGPSPVVAPR